MLQGSSASLGKSGSGSKGGKGPGSKAKDPIQERKEAQLADEAQVLSCWHDAHLPDLLINMREGGAVLCRQTRAVQQSCQARLKLPTKVAWSRLPGPGLLTHHCCLLFC